MDHLSTLPLLEQRLFTRREALAWGETDQTLRAAVRAGVVVRLRYGVYARASDVEGLDERARHLLLARAAVSQQRGPVALAGPTAALARGLDLFGHDLGVIHLARLDGGSARRETGIVHHEVSEPVRLGVAPVDGVLTVDLADAVWQVASMSTLEGAVVTADSALRTNPTLTETLASVVARSHAHPGSRTARLALRLARAEAESPGESLTRVACFRHGIPAPSLQHEVFGADGRLIGRSDFYWEEFRLLGEFDGRIKYERLLRIGETPADSVVREKRREDEMRSTACGMARFVWSDVQPDSAGRRMARLRHELEQSRRLYVRVAG